MADRPDTPLPPTVYTVTPDTTVVEAAFLMASRRVGDLVVVENMVPVGMVTDRDLVVRVLAAGLDGRATTVRAIMSHPLVTITLEQDLGAAVALMAEQGIRRLPIVDEAGRLASILTLDDLLLMDLSHAPALAQVLRRQLRDGRPDTEPAASAALGPPDEPAGAAALTMAAEPAPLGHPAASLTPVPAYGGRPVRAVARATVTPPAPPRHRGRRFGGGGARWTDNLKWFLAIVALSAFAAFLVWLLS